MTVTTNALGANSVEIVVTGPSNVVAVFNAVNTFVYTQGWSYVPDGTLTGNSTNVRQRVYQSSTLSGQTTKYVRINLMDLTLDTATAFSANSSTSGAAVVYNGTNQAYRFNHYQHLQYPRDAFFYRSGSDAGTQPYTIGGNQLAVGIASIQGAINAANLGTVAQGNTWILGNTTGMNTTQLGANPGGWPAITLAAGVGYQFYPGQQLMMYSPSTGHYAVTSVSQYNDANGQLYLGTILHATCPGTVVTDWALLAPTLAYNAYSSPAYVYVSASARHMAIQTRNVDGTFNDWCAVCELENPLGLSSSYPAWGLTTGYMSGNSGYTETVNLLRFDNTYGNVVANTNTTQVGYGYYHPGVSTDIRSNFNQHYYFFNSGALTATGGAGTRQPPLPFMNKQGKLTQFTGPFSLPLTYKGRTSNIAAQFTKVVTTLGEAGYIGTVKKEIIDYIAYPDAASANYVGVNNMATVYYRGMGDVMPTALSTPAGSKHWAVSGSIVTDLVDTDSTNPTTFNVMCDNTQLDYTVARPWTTALGTVSNTLVNASATVYLSGGVQSSYRDQSQWRTTQPTPMGRIYGMKYVTSGMAPLNTMSIKVDGNGFVSSSGTATDHILFSYPSQYVSPTNIAAIAIGNIYANNTNVVAYPVDYLKGKESFTDQANIRVSQTVTVAFPK